ncbi:Leucine Rich Repeat family protein [Trichomonas vaginalis G3]|uniref:Leucine Rich Repeat family protein n=1 Tax=Trichomonas vaginalis (strain ATCC PRA-98 / G3) TaxID=412133 RepID=A2EAS9_TRIV3|nr:uncharacterized protein TVAGG3_0959020 [Trichomonas vaginalis G3]EAY10282.1 Leucine Rich Repeat family protein [Trichomonas vaginalis G3]KAI5487764.1 interleukin-8 biosynthetic process [Trichomonas vaginalis G3]|eukprot:XP_001322505.1 hypothetical protein [Trichomonas vaginalis G3]
MSERLEKIIPMLRRNDPIINSINLVNVRMDDIIADKLIDALNANSFIAKISLQKNQISKRICMRIFDLLKAHPKLTHLEIIDNDVDDESIEHLSNVLISLPPNRDSIMLILRKNSFDIRGARALARAIEKNAPVVWLDLRGNDHIGDAGVKAIAFALTKNRTLSGLDLINCKCGEEGAAELSDALLNNTTLTTLLLQDRFEAKVIYSLGSMLSDANCRLQALYLWSCNITTDLLQKLCESLKNNRCLTTLALSYNKLNDDAAYYISRMILENRSITKLHLGANKFTRSASSYFSICLNKNTTLQYLDISRNVIASEGLWPLSVALSGNKELKFLDLRHNSIDFRGAAMFSDLFEQNESIMTLRLSGNKFGDPSIALMASKLKMNKSIKVLELMDVDMTKKGFTAICHALKENKTLQKLTVSQNNLNSEAMKSLCELLKVNTTLNSISMSGCGIDDQGCAYIAEGIGSNASLSYLDISMNNFTVNGMNKILNALLGNFSLLKIDYNNNTNNDQNLGDKIADYLERNNYYQHNELMKDLAMLATDESFL